MAKTILGETFEQLKEIPKQIVKQAVKLPVEVGKTAIEQVVKSGKRIDPLTGIEIPSPQKIKKIKRQEKKMKATGIPQTRQVISQSAGGPPTQIPAYIAGRPEFGKEPKPKLPPPVSAAKPKMGTAERKLGISG